jgi:hypothetical protein
MGFKAIQSAIEELSELVTTLPAEWRPIPDEQAARRRSDGGWSRKQIVGHMIDSATVNQQRFIRALAGDSDFSLLYAQEEWVDLNGYQSRDWSEIIDLWKAINLHLLSVCRRIGEDQADLICGKDGDPGPWTLAHRVPDYAAHLKMHVEQMRQGPWSSAYRV